MREEDLRQASPGGALSWLDIHFARLIARLSVDPNPRLAAAAALASAATRRGHICLDLDDPDVATLLEGAAAESSAIRRSLESGSSFFLATEPSSRKEEAGSAGFPLGGGAPEGSFPGGSDWRGRLTESGVVGKPGEYKPLILDGGGRLYLHRYWEYQHKLAETLRTRIAAAPAFWGRGDLGEQLGALFPEKSDGEADWQKIAAFAAVRKPFCVVSGGPGTGKTTTVIKILALLLERAHPEKTRIALAAPTGKAAARLQEAIKNGREALACPAWIKEAIPNSASTLHRLLGTVPGSPYFRYNEENPLPVDVVVVDEASMVDLALMAKLAAALPPRARLILLGDKDQLSSVEAGAVLGDICDTGNATAYSEEFIRDCEALCGCRPGAARAAGGNGTGDCIVELRKSYRFSGESGIGALSRAVRDENAEESARILESGAFRDLRWRSRSPSSADPLPGALREEVIEGFKRYREIVAAFGVPENSPGALKEIFDRFNEFRILCAVRMGSCGVGAMNRLVEESHEAGGAFGQNRRWYVGKPVMVLRNDYNLRLFNGDIGIYLPRGGVSGPDFRVFFPGPEGRFRHFHPARLPEHETVYAMTVHKSQGSEFEDVLLVLPDGDSKVLTRELVYTAITRAKRSISIRGSGETIKAAIRRSTRRLSGLSDALRSASR